jgi:hypothetical protein
MSLEQIKRPAATMMVAALLLYSIMVFRMGSSGSSSNSNGAASASSSTGSTSSPAPSYLGQPALSTPPSTATGTSTAVGPRVMPKPRINKAVTEADPLVTRISLGRSDNGSQFGMFLQVFADGTVIDGEGVHRVNGDVLKPVMDAVASGDLAKLKGHCGGPAGDFIENVHVTVFDRSMGRLRASSFSFSGNPQGCDHAVHHLQKVLDELQTKLSAPAPAAPATNGGNPIPPYSPTSPPLPLTTTH